jgi:ribosomal protein S18 acetylase RimI-like enzyme
LTEDEPAVTLRAAREGDRDFFASVYFSTREQELAAFPFSAEEKAAFLAQQFHAQSTHYAAHYSEASTDVILVDGAPAGRLMVVRREHEMLIVDIALLPPYRGRGIGTRLLEPIIDEAVATGSKLTIHVEKMNPALRLYRRLGFRERADDGLYLTMERSPKIRRI